MPVVRNSIAVLSAFCSFGCYTWKPVTMNVNADASTRPARVEVVTTKSERVVIYKPEVHGDSIHGWLDSQSRIPVARAISDVASSRTRQLSSGRTAALLVGTIITGFTVLVAYASTHIVID